MPVFRERDSKPSLEWKILLTSNNTADCEVAGLVRSQPSAQV
jgi:hypothetical protein